MTHHNLMSSFSGGGHSDIFGAPEQKLTHARPKYDQQNSSNVSGALGTTDANVIAEQTARELEAKNGGAPAAQTNGANGGAGGDSRPAAGDSQHQQHQSSRGRVPPGGFSQGFW